jgi:hypothetical protein
MGCSSAAAEWAQLWDTVVYGHDAASCSRSATGSHWNWEGAMLLETGSTGLPWLLTSGHCGSLGVWELGPQDVA